jgi:cytochrome c oxidase subunit 4
MGHHHSNSHSSSGYADQLGHIVPRPVYLKVFVSLLALTAITVLVAQIDISPGWNITMALFVATIKALLVMLFFMHLKYESKITWVYVIFPIALVAIMVAGVYSDNPLRDKPLPVKVQQK